jgi:hypothetical protein
VKDLKYVERVLDLFPKPSRYHVAGKYDLINHSEQPLDQLLLTALLLGMVLSFPLARAQA